MKIHFAFLLGLALVANGQDDRLVRTSEPQSPEEELAGFSVPNGFEISLFAAEPMINKPINLAVDDEGRVWVSSTVEYPYAADRERWEDETGSRVRDSRDAIKILEDTNGDGRADKVSDFADGLNIPTGVLPFTRPGDKLGCIAWSIPNIWYFADTTGDGKADHREVLFGPLGYEKDTHGMCSSFRLGPDGWVYATHGFNNTSTLEAKDGSEIELKSGNVFRFLPDGSRVEVWSRGQVNPFGLAFDHRGLLYSADCHTAPVYQLLQGATYPHFGNPEPAVGFGPTMIEHTHGSTGICGIVYVDRGRWGAAWDDHVVIGNPVNSQVHLDRIEFAGSTPNAIEKPDLVTSKDRWFRPVDLCFGINGELYIADFYNRIIGHYEVDLDHPGRDRERGRIWRVTHKEGNSVAPLKPDEATLDLFAEDPFVRRRAAQQLRNEPEAGKLKELTRAFAETPDEDAHLRHALRLAILETLKIDGALQNLDQIDFEFRPLLRDVPNADAASFLAKQSGLKPDELTHIARYGDEAVVDRAIKSARGLNKSAKAQSNFMAAVQAGSYQRGQAQLPAALIDWATVLAADLLETSEDDSKWTMVGQESPAPWVLQKRNCADGKEATVLSSLRRGESGAEQRIGILDSAEFPGPATMSFWICGHRGHPNNEAHEKNFVALLDGDREVFRVYPPRNDTCQKVKWEIPVDLQSKPVRLRIVDGDNGGSFAWIGVTRISGAAISTDDFSSDPRDEILPKLAQLLKLTAPVSLRDQLAEYLPKSDTPQPAAANSEELQALIKERVAAFKIAKPNPERGRKVFQQHCAACHQIGGEGGLIAPQLDGVGSRGLERLCEDILDPNRNVDAHFRLVDLQLKDGSALTGFILLEDGDFVRVRDLGGEAHSLTKSQIESRKTLPISLMPSVFGELIPEEEFHDLAAWLLENEVPTSF